MFVTFPHPLAVCAAASHLIPAVLLLLLLLQTAYR